MNPILGETYEMKWEDGSHIFLEQTSHHPPVSHFYMMGPNSKYKYYGYSVFSSGAGINSLKVFAIILTIQLYNKGKRSVEFKDGQKISFNFGNEVYNNTFFGKVYLETLGELVFRDVENKLEAKLKFDKVRKK